MILNDRSSVCILSNICFSLILVCSLVFFAGCGGESGGNPTGGAGAPPLLMTLTVPSAQANGNQIANLIAEITRLAKGSLLIQGKLRQGAYPSARIDSGKAKSVRTIIPGCPTITQPDILTPQGFTIVLDYGIGCIDAFDGVTRSGKITIDVTNLTIDLNTGAVLSAEVTASFTNFVLGEDNIEGSAKIEVISLTSETWDLDLTASNTDEIKTLSFRGAVAFSNASDIETINGTGTLLSNVGGLINFSLADLQFDIDLQETPLICDDPIGGSLKLTGTNSATFAIGLPDPGCGFAVLSVDGEESTLISFDGTPHPTADLAISAFGSPNPVLVGQPVTYNITIRNNGPDAAHDVILTGTPSGVDILSLSPMQGDCQTTDNRFTCSAGTINPGSGVVLVLVVTPAQTGNLTHVLGTTSSVSDFNPVNGSFTIVTGVVPIIPQPSPISRIELTPSLAVIPTGGAKQFTATAFDQSNFPMFGVVFTWNSSDTSVATIESNGLATGLAAGTANVTATASGVTSDPAVLTVTADQIRKITLPTNDIIYDPNTQKIYASIPSSAGNIGNSITLIDPVTGEIGPSIFIGSEPVKIAISGDGQFLYVALDGSAAVRRFDIATLTSGLQFSLGSDSFFGQRFAEDIEVLPGDPHAVAVSRKYKTVSPRAAGVAIFDDGVQRSNTTPGHFQGSNVIEFSETASMLYGFNGETTGFDFHRMTVDDSGVSLLDDTSNLISGFGVDIEFEGGRIYATSGQIVDPETLTLVGTFQLPAFGALVRPDSGVGRVFFLAGTGFGESTPVLSAFDQDTFLSIGSLDIPGVSGIASSLIRWGDNGLAFRTSNNQLFLIQTSLIAPFPSP